ncbi:uncharacterized protein [Anabrus simplex]|uniref:uncharacterized protein n=1 Tax=Anabrus simplex TaxID=316456 RepID=UPI0035A345D2
MEQWRCVVWSSESWFQLHQADLGMRMWRMPHEAMDPACLQRCVQVGGGLVLVWAAFSWCQLGPIVQLQGALTDQEDRSKTLSNSVVTPKVNHSPEVETESPVVSIPSSSTTAVSWPSAGILRQALMSFNSIEQEEKPNVNATDQDIAVRKISLGVVDDIRLSLATTSDLASNKTVPLGSLPATAFLTGSLPLTVSIPFSTLTPGTLLSNGAIPLRVCSSVSDVPAAHTLSNSLPESSDTKTSVPSATVITSGYQLVSSLPSKDESLTVIYSTIPKLDAPLTNLPLPPMSEVKSGLANHISILTHPQTSEKHNKNEQTIISIDPAKESGENSHFSDIPTSNVPIKLDSSSDSCSDFSHATSMSGSLPIKFHSDNSSSSDIVIPVSNDLILSKGEGQTNSSADMSHILTIPIPPGTNDSLPLPLSISNSNSSAASTTTSVWPSSTSSPVVSSSCITRSIISTLPSIVPFTSSSSQDSSCYALQSPTEILSQLSKAGVLPAMSSSQVSSVLSALGSDSHMDLETDASHHTEMLPAQLQVLHADKVSTLTQTDDLVGGDDSLMVQHVMEHLVEQDTAPTEASSTKPTSSAPRFVAMVVNNPVSGQDSKSEHTDGTDKPIEKLVPVLDEPSHGISVRDFLVATNNLKCPAKKNTSRELLQWSGENSNSETVVVKQEGMKLKKGGAKAKKRLKKLEEREELKESSIAKHFMEEVACFKCKFCPFLSLDQATVTEHINEEHVSKVLRAKQKMNCPGCSNVFFSTSSLSVHLTQDHEVSEQELQIIMNNAVRQVARQKAMVIVEENSAPKDRNDPLIHQRQASPSAMDPPVPPPNVSNGEIATNSVNDVCEYPVISPSLISFKEEERVEEPAPTRKRGRPRGSKNKPMGSVMLPKMAGNGYRCNINNCAVSLRSHDNIEYHRRCHRGTEFACPECDHVHKQWSNMTMHLWRCHLIDMELYSCDQCDFKTNRYGKLVNLHKWIHGTERPFLCDSCGKGFKNRKQLRNHKATHKPKVANLMECEVCSRSFSNKRMLRLHMEHVHNKFRPHLCSYCGYSVSSVSSLKMHMRKHTGEKPFRCDQCTYRTADHNSLRRHKMQHSGDKPYKCPHCTYACIQSSTYKAHLKTKHPGMDDGLMFSCSMCAFHSIKEKNYLAHLAEHKPGANVRLKQGEEDAKKKQQQQKKKNSAQLPVIHLQESDMNVRLAYITELRSEDLDNPTEIPVSFGVDEMEETEQITGDICESSEEITGDIKESSNVSEPVELKFKIRKEEDL